MSDMVYFAALWLDADIDMLNAENQRLRDWLVVIRDKTLDAEVWGFVDDELAGEPAPMTASAPSYHLQCLG
jgi:hypothetical protein